MFWKDHDGGREESPRCVWTKVTPYVEKREGRDDETRVKEKKDLHISRSGQRTMRKMYVSVDFHTEREFSIIQLQ